MFVLIIIISYILIVPLLISVQMKKEMHIYGIYSELVAVQKANN